MLSATTWGQRAGQRWPESQEEYSYNHDIANDSEPLDLTGTPEELVKKIYGVDREQWGQWKLNHETDCLVYTNPKYPALAYDIPVLELKTQAQAFGWIRQLEEKTWCSEEDLGHLVRAIFAIMTHQRVLGTLPAV